MPKQALHHLALREDAKVKPLHERGRLLEATAATPTSRMVQIITPGWGSSGYYSAAVLERAATDKVIPAGTHMYLNHASATEHADRPERDVEKIAAVLVEDATWDGERLTAPAELVGPHAELIESLAPYIGVSISGSATDIVVGEAEGRTGPIIEGLAHVDSVDFVTHAGRGGAILLESARPSIVNARAAAHGVAEATANDTREELQTQLRDLLGGENSWVWVRDFDDSTVWYEHETPDSSGTYALAYTTSDTGAVTLSGSPTEVRATTTYVPVARPDSTTPTTEESQEGTMEITDEEYAQLQKRAGRADELEANEAQRDRHDRAASIVTEKAKAGEVTFTALESRGLLAELPVTNDGKLDEAAFGTSVDEQVNAAKEAAAEAASNGGRLTGFGASTSTTTDGVAESGAPTKSAWGRPLAESKGA